MNTMPHLLCIPSGPKGLLYASFGLSKQLQQAGYRITYASPAEVGAIVAANGFEFVQLPPINLFDTPPMPQLSKWQRLLYGLRHIKQLQQAALEQMNLTPFYDLIETQRPDLWIIDMELHEYLMTTIAKGQPTVLLSPWFSTWHRKGLPPVLHDTIPGQGWKGSPLGLRLTWWRIRWQRKWIFFKLWLRQTGTNRRSILKLYAKQIGFPLQYARENYWPGQFTYSKLPVFSMTLEEMEFPHDKRPNLHYVGTMVDTKRVELRQDKQLQQQLDTIFERAKDNQNSLIYCSVSSVKKGDEDFLLRVIDAVAERKDWVLLLSLGGLLGQEKFQALPENVFAFSWLPQLQVLAQANCSINHGGIHTINECIHFKVPMLVYSGKRSDQNGCAARVAYHGLGIMADKDEDDSATIASKIEEILTNELYKKNIARMNAHHLEYELDGRLPKLVAQFLDTTAPNNAN